jgi:hypothetical protein
VVPSSRSYNAADAGPPPRPEGLRLPRANGTSIFLTVWISSNRDIIPMLSNQKDRVPQQNANPLFLREPLEQETEIAACDFWIPRFLTTGGRMI